MEFSKCKWTPFAGMTVNGSVRRVTLRGEVVFIDGKILAKPGSGKNIATLKPSTTTIGDKTFNDKISKLPKLTSEEKNLQPKSLNQNIVKINQSTGDSNLLIPNRVRAKSTSTQNGLLNFYLFLSSLNFHFFSRK